MTFYKIQGTDREKPWVANVYRDGKTKHLGVFADEGEAKACFEEAKANIDTPRVIRAETDFNDRSKLLSRAWE